MDQIHLTGLEPSYHGHPPWTRSSPPAVPEHAAVSPPVRQLPESSPTAPSLAVSSYAAGIHYRTFLAATMAHLTTKYVPVSWSTTTVVMV